MFVCGGYAGVEAVAQLHELAQHALRSYPRLKDAPQRWILADAAPRILASVPGRLGEYAARQLVRRGIEIRTGARLLSAEGGRVVLSDGTDLAAETLVWSAGVAPSGLGAALGQARSLARNIRRERRGRAPKPYAYRTKGQMALLGRHSAIADVQGLHLRGVPAWLFARTYHLHRLPLRRRRLRVAADWVVSAVFPWDITQLGSLGHPRPLGASPNRTT